MEAAAAVFEQDFPGDYTVNISCGWGTYDNSTNSSLTNPNSGAFSLGGVLNSNFTSYSELKGWLTANATSSAQLTAVQSLPASSTAFPRGANSFIVSSAEEKALGVLTGNSGALDGSIGFNVGDTSDSSGWKPVAVCEICHALGWITGDYNSDDGFPWVADLYRYSAPGRYQWIGGQPAYFSIDGGNTDLADFSTSFDYTLFPNVAANDPLRLPFESSARTLTSLDIEALSVIGFGVQSHASTVVSSPRNSYGGDVNDDGRSDILWQNANGQAAIRELNGTTVIGGGLTGPNPGPSWRAIGTGDFNHDGHSDILWQNADGQASIWR